VPIVATLVVVVKLAELALLTDIDVIAVELADTLLYKALAMPPRLARLFGNAIKCYPL
jgi:hypothetical protein